MANNTAQIFTLHPKINWCTLTAANTALDGTGTLDAAGTATSTTSHLGTLFTATSTSGIDSRIDRIRCQPLGTNVATVLRIFVNNGSTNATAANNTLIAEVTLAATTANAAVAILSSPVELPIAADLNALFPNGLPNGYKLMATLGTAVSAGWQITAFGGDYG
jgi:hypothetical protein